MKGGILMGNRLRELREEKGLTLKELVDDLKKVDLKISSDTLAKYERGDREPKLERWQKLADYFDVSVGYLQGVSDIKNYNKILSSPDVTFKDWIDVATQATGDYDQKIRAISDNEFKSFFSEMNIIEFDMIFKALINKFDSEENQRKYTDYKNKVDSTGARSNISELVKSVFKIALTAKIGDKEAEVVYKKIWDEVNGYFGYDELPF